MKRGCPECEVSILFHEFQEEVDDELAQLAERREYCEKGKGREYKWRWSRQKLVADVASISNLNARLDGKGYDSSWTVLVQRLVIILRQEQNLQERISREDRERELEAELQSTRGGRSTNR
jgi:hypothetical protein